MSTATARTVQEPQLPIVIVGHVDHGKSTLVGRLLYDTGSLPEGKTESLRASAKARGIPFEWSFVMDAFQAERRQGITIDTTQIFFKTARRRYVIIDAPGHKEFLRNMITGAASAEAALLVVDAAEGVLEQTRRHAYSLHLLDVRQLAVVVNKMDLVGYDEDRFAEVASEVASYLAELGLTPAAIIPVSARDGDNIGKRAASMPWYSGPIVVEALDGFTRRPQLEDRPLRLPVQDVYKFDDRRLVVGRIECGRLRVGDLLEFSPTGKRARIATIEAWNAPTPVVSAATGQSIAITLDEDIYIERGAIAHAPTRPPIRTHELHMRLFWLGKEPLRLGDSLKLKLATAEYPVTVQAIDAIIDVETLARHESKEVPPLGVAEVTLRSRAWIAADAFAVSPRTGRGVLVRDYDIIGGCIVAEEVTAANDDMVVSVDHAVTTDARARANGHRGGILWLTGLSGAGKSTLAMALERELFARGYQAFVLDGDNLRHGLNADLDFSPEDRSENIRRAAEVAKLFAEAGFIVLTAFISPYRRDRALARERAGTMLHEVYVKADLAVCETRDPKGLYRRARAGEILSFTGISAPYEPSETPELVLDTATHSVDQCLADLLAYVEDNFALRRPGTTARRGVA